MTRFPVQLDVFCTSYVRRYVCTYADAGLRIPTGLEKRRLRDSSGGDKVAKYRKGAVEQLLPWDPIKCLVLLLQPWPFPRSVPSRILVDQKKPTLSHGESPPSFFAPRISFSPALLRPNSRDSRVEQDTGAKRAHGLTATGPRVSMLISRGLFLSFPRPAS